MTEPRERLVLDVDVVDHVGPDVDADGLEQYLYDVFQMYDDVTIEVTGDFDD